MTVTKSLFIKGKTDYQGCIKFTVPSEYANLAANLWKVKAQRVIFTIPKGEQWHNEMPVSLNGNFCYPPEIGDSPDARSLVKLSIGLVKGFEKDYVSLDTGGNEYISFINPPSTIVLLLKDETKEEGKEPGIKNVQLMVHLILASDN